MAKNATKADLMMAKDAVARAFHAMKLADREWEATGSEAANFNQAEARKAFKRVVLRREAIQRCIWAQEDAAL